MKRNLYFSYLFAMLLTVVWTAKAQDECYTDGERDYDSCKGGPGSNPIVIEAGEYDSFITSYGIHAGRSRGVRVEPGGALEFEAGNFIHLYPGEGFSDARPGFLVEAGGSFQARINPGLLSPQQLMEPFDGSYQASMDKDVGIGLSNYPNPFNPTTRITYRISEERYVRIEVYNILGERVSTLVDGIETAGEHHVIWDATNGQGQVLPSGIYVYRLLSGNFIQSRHMVLLQ